MCEKVISLIDMDCFYVQVETRENPSLKGKPAAVVQYNTWKGGGIIAVNYEARAMGVTRQMRGDQAREKCPDIVLVQVPEVREKADLTKYRNAGREVIQVLNQFGAVVERASIDEAYLDLSSLVDRRLEESRELEASQLPNTYIGGCKDERSQALLDWLAEVRSSEGSELDLRLAVGAAIVEEMRAAVFQQTQFRCSAGIAHCKTLAKLCCGLNKPNKQTVLPQSAVATLYDSLPITKVRGLGGKLGESVVTELGVETMGQLAALTLRQIGASFEEKTAHWLHLLGRGFDNEEVCERELPKSIGCSKNFRGPDMLDSRAKVKERLGKLLEELTERILKDRDAHNRTARGLSVGANVEGLGFVSRAGPLHSYNYEKLCRDAFALLSKLNTAPEGSEAWTPPLKNISVSASKFEDLNATLGNTQSVATYFRRSTNAGGADETVTASPASQTRLRTPTPVPSENIAFRTMEKLEASSDASSKHSFLATSPACDDVSSNHHAPHVQVGGDNDAAAGKKSGHTRPAVVASGGSFFRRKLAEMREEKEKKEKIVSQVGEKSGSLPQPETSADAAAAAPVTVKVTSDILGVPLEEEREEEACGVDMGELIPNLENFDPAILDLLPVHVRRLADKRLDYLRAYAKSRTLCRTVILANSDRQPTVPKVKPPQRESEEVSLARPSGAQLRLIDIDTQERTDPSALTNGVAEVTRQVELTEPTDGLKLGDNATTCDNVESLPTNGVAVQAVNETVPANRVSAAETLLSVEGTVSHRSEEDDVVVCRQCGCPVSPFELPEHLDFHLAEQLQEQEGGSSRGPLAVRTVLLPSSLGGKRKRTAGGVEASRDSSAKKRSRSGVDISKFFTKK